MLQKEGATVSIATSRTPAPTLDALCAMADIVISVVGKSGLIRKEMVRPGATLVNVGTTFDGERLIPDIDLGSIDGSGHLVTPVPGGIGPSPVTVLMENLVTRAEARAQSRGESSEQTLLGKAEVANFIGNSDWQCLEEKSLRKSFVADNFETATMMVNDIGAIANDMNHHPQVSIQPVIGGPAPACFNNGCSVEFTLHSLDVAGISDRDLSLAKRIDQELMGA